MLFLLKYGIYLLKNFPLFLSSADFFFRINFSEKFFQEYDQSQTVWIKIRPDVLSGLIWVQTVFKSYQQTTLGDKELNVEYDSFMILSPLLSVISNENAINLCDRAQNHKNLIPIFTDL